MASAAPDSGLGPWRWTLHRPVEEEPIWEGLLWEEVPGQWNLQGNPKQKRILIEVVFEDRAAAEAWQSVHGGNIEALAPPEEWFVPAPIPPPIRIRDRFLVTSETDDERIEELRAANPDRELLIVPAEMAFGTGTHPTTRTCLRLLCDAARPLQREGRPWRCLDLGCGSAILSIAARKLGAEVVRAVEIDRVALNYAERNARRNGVRGIEFVEADLLADESAFADGPWDIVLANIFSNILRPIFPPIRRALGAGGILLYSGILRAHEKEVRTAALAAGFSDPDTVRIGKWVTGRCR